MSPAVDIARSGLSAAMLRLDSAAHNIANAQTAGFRRQQVVQGHPGAEVPAGPAQRHHPHGGVDVRPVARPRHPLPPAFAFNAVLKLLSLTDSANQRPVPHRYFRNHCSGASGKLTWISVPMWGSSASIIFGLRLVSSSTFAQPTISQAARLCSTLSQVNASETVGGLPVTHSPGIFTPCQW